MHMRAILLDFGLSLPFYLAGVVMLDRMQPSVWPIVFISVGEGLRLACWHGLRKREPQAQPPQREMRSLPSRRVVRSRPLVRVVVRQQQRQQEWPCATPLETTVATLPVASKSLTTIDELMRREG